MKTSNKKGSNFLVHNKNEVSSDYDVDMRIRHRHLVAVQEDKNEDEHELEDDAAKEGGITSDDKDTDM